MTDVIFFCCVLHLSIGFLATLPVAVPGMLLHLRHVDWEFREYILVEFQHLELLARHLPS